MREQHSSAFSSPQQDGSGESDLGTDRATSSQLASLSINGAGAELTDRVLIPVCARSKRRPHVGEHVVEDNVRATDSGHSSAGGC